MAYVTGFQLKGNKTIINQMSISYGQVGDSQNKVQTLVGLYSPRRSTYDLTFPGNTIARPFESRFGGPGGNVRIQAINRSTDLTISGIRVDVADSETFIADSYQPAVPIAGEASLSMDGNNVQLEVDIQNNGNFALENVSLLLGTDIIALGDLGPGDSKGDSKTLGLVATGPGKPVPGGGPVYISGPGTGSPLTYHAETILDSTDYYNDRDVFPRWQLLQAFEGEYPMRTGGGSTSVLPNNVVTIVAWSEQPQLEITINEEEHTDMHTTLYLMQLPVKQNIISGNDVSIPLALLNWQVLGESGIYQASIQNLYLQGGWIEFEYKPWPEFQNLDAGNLAIVLEPQDLSMSFPPPEVRLWNWQQEVWETTNQKDWGTMPVPEPSRYIGPANAVRIRLQDNSDSYSEIQVVYPILTGNLP